MNKNTKTIGCDKEPIVLNRGMKAQLMKKFGVTRPTVNDALTYRKSTPLHQAIRQEATRMVDEFMNQFK